MRLVHLCKKAIIRIKSIFIEFNDIRECYSFKYAVYCLLWWLGFYLRNKKITYFYTKKKQIWLDLYIEKKYNYVINKYKKSPESNKIVDSFCIWCFWGQGENRMPDLVKACYKQMVYNNPGKVRFLTLSNVDDYVKLPSIVYKKLKEGNLLYAHFSDILRNALLAKYGGLWLDLTCWVVGPIPSMVYENIFYSPHDENNGIFWCTYAMGSNCKESVTFSFVRDMLIAVCEHEKTWPDYLFQDRLISYAHRKIAASKNAINQTPNNSTKRFLLFPMMNKAFNIDYYKKLLETDWVFKLSYKSYYKKEINGMPTFYKMIVDGDLKHIDLE